MNRLIFILTIFFLSLSAQSASPVSKIRLPEAYAFMKPPKPSAKEQFRIAQMKWFASLSVADYQKAKGRKMNILEKASFKLSQHRMKKMLTQYSYGEVTTLQKISWLLKGLILGPIAVLLAYLFLTGDDSELIKWTWFGFAGWAVLLAIILLFLV